MRLIIRADSNKIIAMGHVMRCLSIADAIKEKGGEVLFVCASDDAENLINQRGYEVRVLNSDYRKLDSEKAVISPVIKDFNPDLIMVDSYFASDEYFKFLSGYAPTAYVDDFADKAYPVDLMINYNAYGEEVPYKDMYKAAGLRCPELVLGPSYAPLRKEFKNPPRVKRDDTYRILLTTGGSDNCHIAIAVAEAFLEKEAGNTQLCILVGPYSLDKEKLELLASRFPKRIQLYSNITEMPLFLAGFDVALSAAGSTSYELCCMSIPFILYCTADNQHKIHDSFAQKGFPTAGYAEDNPAEVVDRIVSFAMECREDLTRRMELATKARSITDGYGADKIAQKLFELTKEK